MNEYSLRRGLVTGYKIGLENDSIYVPVPDRDVRNFRKWEGAIKVYDNRAKVVTRIGDWDKEVIVKEKFEDKSDRGDYYIGYFLVTDKAKPEPVEEVKKVPTPEQLFEVPPIPPTGFLR